MAQKKKILQISKLARSSDVSRRAWNILRLALLWARSKGVVNKRLMLQFIKTSLLGQSKKGNGALYYGDRQLSFDATPIIHVRMHRPNSMRFTLPRIPCINPHVADSTTSNHHYYFDDDDDDDDDDQARTSFLIQNGDQESCDHEQGGTGIDLKAEQFIANFYEQLRLQRQRKHDEIASASY
ncbi:hypothetical protein SSX86_022066 [Deinandra increscens subsp. villosa]|uniref:DUF761 domain-containing protein n=1 Tax=Deinandra increscens subsp. villosa TaxID=3103831 RepID=A0AAP0CJM0_9ASTR